MSFKLLIECSKDIDVLHIGFSDGSSVVSHKKTKKTKNKKNVKQSTQNKEKYLDTSADLSHVCSSHNIVKPPVIDDINRDALVAEELQKLDI